MPTRGLHAKAARSVGVGLAAPRRLAASPSRAVTPPPAHAVRLPAYWTPAPAGTGPSRGRCGYPAPTSRGPGFPRQHATRPPYLEPISPYLLPILAAAVRCDAGIPCRAPVVVTHGTRQHAAPTPYHDPLLAYLSLSCPSRHAATHRSSAVRHYWYPTGLRRTKTLHCPLTATSRRPRRRPRYRLRGAARRSPAVPPARSGG